MMAPQGTIEHAKRIVVPIATANLAIIRKELAKAYDKALRSAVGVDTSVVGQKKHKSEKGLSQL
jgi:hypothetical protein